MGFATRLRVGVTIAISCGVTLALHAPLSAGSSLLGPYSVAPFVVARHPHAFGQDPAWTRRGDVLSAQLDSVGARQIYHSRLDGRAQRCLTCRTVAGPNGLPQERPEGDWIMFESYGQQPQHLGAPGLGGYGGDLYVMRPDGSHPFRLTTTSDPAGGARYDAGTGVPYDNFHAYWSPDGRHVAWTHTEARPLTQGGQTWEMLAGDFTVRGGVPSLRGVRVVGRPYGVYETRPWAPDGSGFLFSAAGGYRSPYGSTPPGWGHMQLYDMRLYGRGASPARPRVTQISDELPVYQEQAIFTPDLRTVIMMSNRGAPTRSWYDLIVAAAQRTRFDAPDTGSTGTLQFLADFSGRDFHSDLYAVDIRTRAIRRLTNLGGIIPEFFWNRDDRQIIWGLNGVGGATWTGRFLGLDAAQRRVPRRIPAPGLYGRTIDMARVSSQAQPVRSPGPTDNRSVAVPPPSAPAPGFPHARVSSDRVTVPAVVSSYIARWKHDLAALGEAANKSAFTTNPLGL